MVDVPAKLSARMRMFTTGQGRKTGDTDAHAIALVGVRITGLPRSCQMSNWRSCACWSTGADASVRNTWGALAVAFMYPVESHQRRMGVSDFRCNWPLASFSCPRILLKDRI